MKEQRLRNGRDHLLALAVLLLCLLAMTGCGGGGGSSSDGGGGGSPGAPTIALSSSAVDFGGVVLDSFSFRSITVQNTGNADLSIGQITQPPAPFSITGSSTCAGATLPPAQTCTLNVQFAPIDQGAFPGSFTIASNDSQNNPVTVTLNGTGRGLSVSINQVETTLCSPSPSKLKIFVSVTDRNGPVQDLQAKDFAIFEYGSSVPSQIGRVTAIPQPPTQTTSVGLALDYSGSMVPFTADLETATLSFLGNFNFPPDFAQIIKFDETVYTVQQFTDDGSSLISAVTSPFPGVRRGTSLYDAVLKSINDTAGQGSNNLAVVAVTDGNDTESANTIDDAIDAATTGKQIPVYTIGIGTANQDTLTQLAEGTGGRYYYAPDSTTLQDIYLRISGGLISQYEIEFFTSSSGGLPVSLDLTVTDPTSGNTGEDSEDAAKGC